MREIVLKNLKVLSSSSKATLHHEDRKFPSGAYITLKVRKKDSNMLKELRLQLMKLAGRDGYKDVCPFSLNYIESRKTHICRIQLTKLRCDNKGVFTELPTHFSVQTLSEKFPEKNDYVDVSFKALYIKPAQNGKQALMGLSTEIDTAKELNQ